MNLRMRRRLAWVVLALLAASAWDGWNLWRAHSVNAAIAGNAPLSDEDANAHLRFAAAHRLAEKGETLRALTVYKRLSGEADPALREAARFNSANLHLREAMRLRATNNAGAQGQALPLVEMAKQGYRDVLKSNPAHWDARYNLERALRISPENEEPDEEVLLPPQSRERAATTMRGFSLGLP